MTLLLPLLPYSHVFLVRASESVNAEMNRFEGTEVPTRKAGRLP